MSETCKSCTSKLSRHYKGITCQVCSDNYHVNCIDNLSPAHKTFLSSNDTNPWTCSKCLESLKSLNEENLRLKNENSRLVADNQQLRNRLDTLETQFSAFKSELKQEILQELRNNLPSPPTNNISQPLNEQVLACLREEKERDKRRLNLCLRNMPEADSHTTDRLQIIHLFKTKLGANETDLNAGIRNIKRVGTQSDERPRIIIIECSNSDLKRFLLQNSFKLKNHRLINNRNVFLTPDMTKNQLEDDRKLREELRRRRDNGENVFIRKGQIVLRSSFPNPQTHHSSPSQSINGNPTNLTAV